MALVAVMMRVSTSSAASPTRSWAALSPSSPSRAQCKHLFSLRGGATSGAQPRLTSLSTTASSGLRVTHHGPAYRLSLCNILLFRDVYAKLDGWFRSPALDGLEEIEFSYAESYSNDRYLYAPPRPPRPLPPSALRFAPTLRVVCISRCDFPEINAASVLLLLRLKQLKLHDVTISEAAFQRLLAGCTVLDSLQLDGIHGLSSVRIISPTLRSIGVSVSHNDYKAGLVFQELVIENAPCLERLIPFGVRGALRTIMVLVAPKLTVLGYLSSKISKIVFGTIVIKEMIPIRLGTLVRTVKVLVLQSIGPNLDAIIGFLRCFPCVERLYIQEMIPVRFTALVRTVKVLVLQSIGPNLDAVVGFLRCFPCTEKLYIQSCCRDMKNVLQYDTLDPMECLELHLRTIVMNNYEGKEADVNFAQFFVLNAKVLRIMKFCAYDKSTYSGKWIADQPGWLQLDKRASRDARFYFTRDRCSFDRSSNHTHDMSMADPFASALRKRCTPA